MKEITTNSSDTTPTCKWQEKGSQGAGFGTTAWRDDKDSCICPTNTIQEKNGNKNQWRCVTDFTNASAVSGGSAPLRSNTCPLNVWITPEVVCNPDSSTGYITKSS